MFVGNQRGSVLIIVVVAAAALIVLGVTLSTIALSDQGQAVRQQRNNEAFYLARSGAETVAEVLLDKLNSGGKIEDYLGTVDLDLGDGSFSVEVVQEADGNILIKSTGCPGSDSKYSETVTLSLLCHPGEEAGGEEGGSQGYFPIFDMAVFSDSTIKLTGSAKIDGNAGTNSTSPGAVDLAWSTAVNNLYIGEGGDPGVVVNAEHPPGNYKALGCLEQKRVYPAPIFPEFPEDLPKRSNIQETGSRKGLVIDQPGEYNEIHIGGSCELAFNVGSGDLKVRVKRFTVDGSGKITINRSGSGRLILYVDNYFNSSAYFNHGKEPGALVIYFKGTNSNLKFSEYLQLPAHFFALQASLKIGGSAGIVGTIITLGSKVEISGDSGSIVQVVYAPNARVEVTGSGKLLGAIVCDSFTAVGGSKITYDSRAENLWQEVPELGFDFGTDPGDGSGSGDGSGDGSGSGAGTSTKYERGYWSD